MPKNKKPNRHRPSAPPARVEAMQKLRSHFAGQEGMLDSFRNDVLVALLRKLTEPGKPLELLSKDVDQSGRYVVHITVNADRSGFHLTLTEKPSMMVALPTNGE